MIPNLKSIVINMTFSIVITMARRLVRLSPKETKNQEKREEFFSFLFSLENLNNAMEKYISRKKFLVNGNVKV